VQPFICPKQLLWPLGDKAAVMRRRCWCIALCEGSGIHYTMYVTLLIFER